MRLLNILLLPLLASAFSIPEIVARDHVELSARAPKGGGGGGWKGGGGSSSSGKGGSSSSGSSSRLASDFDLSVRGVVGVVW